MTQATGAAGRETKIAVVVIHGMGEQKPMQTLRGFVESVWQRDAALFKGLKPEFDHAPWDVWSKPDHISGSAELRRITTARARDPAGPAGAKLQRTDFFELHWADLTADTNWSDFLAWFRALLLRRPWRGDVPPRVLLVWLLLWALVAALGVSALAAAWPGVVKALGRDPLSGSGLGSLLSWGGWAVLTAVLGAVGLAVKSLLTAYLGDVARYVSSAPRNIKVRQEARQRGLKLLDELAAAGSYERIVVVGHSLGSVLAHDLVMLAWSQAARSIRAHEGSPLYRAVGACESAADQLLTAAGYVGGEPGFLRDDPSTQCRRPSRPANAALPGLLRAYRGTQRELFRALAATPAQVRGQQRQAAWLISDLVTMGSPLTHAEFLIARNLCDLRMSVRMRELLRCPPLLEPRVDGTWRFSFDEPRGGQHWQLHHAAALGPVRWTNLHDSSGPLAFWLGDLISGPVGRDFGPGVADVPVRIARPRGLLLRLGLARLFTHTLYWTDFLRGIDHKSTTPAHVQALRDALNLLDEEAVEDRLLQRMPQA
jgi:hypothetical protein